MMSRLVTFGCSCTYGHALPDCTALIGDGPGPKFSRYAWPSLLADKCQLELSNMSSPGNSNQRILLDIYNFEFKETDHVIVLWTYPDRDYIILNDGTGVNILLNNYGLKSVKDNIRNYYLLAHSNNDIWFKAWMIYFAAFNFFTLKKIPFTFLSLQKDPLLESIRPNFASNIELLDLYFYNIAENYPKAFDKIHPGVEAHKVFSELLYEKLPELHNK